MARRYSLVNFRRTGRANTSGSGGTADVWEGVLPVHSGSLRSPAFPGKHPLPPVYS